MCHPTVEDRHSPKACGRVTSRSDCALHSVRSRPCSPFRARVWKAVEFYEGWLATAARGAPLRAHHTNHPGLPVSRVPRVEVQETHNVNDECDRLAKADAGPCAVGRS